MERVDRCQIFAYCAESRSRPLGASGGVTVSDNGDVLFSPSTELNMNANEYLVGYDGKPKGHSQQYRNFIQHQNRFWYYVLNRLSIPHTYSQVCPEE